jgi:hypothetical protein
MLAWTAAHSGFLKAGILGSLVVFLAAGLASGSGGLRADDAAAFFQLGIAVTVLPLGWLSASRGRAVAEPRVPFPVHIQALIGTAWVLWLFRLVGLAWLAAGSLHVLGRLGLP